MREILFRGKRIDNGELVEGGIVHQTDFYGDSVDRYFIIDGTDTDDNIGSAYRVLPDTVGQFTGLTDKNGKKIFEGDIIKGKFSNYAIWADEAERAFVYGKSYKGGYKNLMSDYLLKSSCPNGIEIIGNIHDNPELLEVEK